MSAIHMPRGFIADTIKIVETAAKPGLQARGTQSVESDPAVIAGRAFQSALDAVHVAEDEEVTDKILHENTCSHLNDALYAAIDAITHTRPTTLAGVLVHLSVMYEMADRIANFETFPDEDYRAFKRCAYSAFHVLAASACVEPETIGARYFMPDYCDPLPEIERPRGAPERDSIR